MGWKLLTPAEVAAAHREAEARTERAESEASELARLREELERLKRGG
jgi:hypothetical protein